MTAHPCPDCRCWTPDSWEQRVETAARAMKLWDGTTSSESSDEWFLGLAAAALHADADTGEGPDIEGHVLDDAATRLRAALTPPAAHTTDQEQP